MASSNHDYSGDTGVIVPNFYVTEVDTDGYYRRVRLQLTVYTKDYAGTRDGAYDLYCPEEDAEIENKAMKFSGSEKTVFDETVEVAVSDGIAYFDLSYSFTVYTGKGNRTVSGWVTQLYLTEEPEGPDLSPSTITLGAASVQMGKNLLITVNRSGPGCTHTLDFSFGSHFGTIATGVGGSYGWQVPDLCEYIPNQLSGVCTVTCYTYADGDYAGYTTATVTITVPDASVPSVTGGRLTLGSKASISCKRNSAAFTVKLKLSFKDSTYEVGEGKQDSLSWTPSYDLAKLIPNLTEATGTLLCTTYNGSAEVGTESCTLRLTVPENDVTRPAFTLSDLTLEPVSSLGEDFAGVYMRGKTGLSAAMAAASAYSTISSCTLTAGSQSAEGNPAVIDLLVNEGEVRVTAKVTDARGFSRTVTTAITILPYRNPRIIPLSGYDDVICERAKETGELSASGTYLAIRAGKSFTSVVLDGKEKNSCHLRYRWKPNGAAEYGSWITLLGSDSADTEVSLLVGNVVASLQTSYLVQLEAADTLGGTHTLTFQIMTEAISFVLYDGPDGAGFGKYPEQPHVVDIASHMTLLVRGKLEIVGSSWADLGLAAGVYESGYDYGRKESTGCHYLVSNGNHVYLAFNCSFSYSGAALTINDKPVPEEYRPARPVFSLCPANDRALAMVSMNPDGFIRLEWVQNSRDTVPTAAAEVTWMDGYLDYWTT